MKRSFLGLGAFGVTVFTGSLYFKDPSFRHNRFITKSVVEVARTTEQGYRDSHIVTTNLFGDEFHWETLNNGYWVPFNPHDNYVYTKSAGKLRPILVNKKAMSFVPVEHLKECMRMQSLE